MPEPNMKCGISSYAFTWAIGVPGKEPSTPMSIWKLIEKAKELGADCLQIADNLPLDQFSASEFGKIYKFALENKIDLEVGSRKMTSENLARYLPIAIQLNSPILRMVIDGSGFEPSVKEIIQIIKEFIPDLEKSGIVLAIENHDRLKAKEFKEIMDRCSSEYVRICLDSVNSMGADEGVEYVTDLLAPYTVNWHVKEYHISRVYHKMGFIVEGCPLGKGMLPFDFIYNSVKDTCISAILEQWTPPEKTVAETVAKEELWARESMRELRGKLGD